jgi:pimeloyl-ACP methyl ester carboxylesterase
VSYLRWIAAVGVVLALTTPAPAIVNAFRVCSRHQVDNLNKTIAGRVLDYTDNHGTDRRIWSHALGEKRDLYVYLPPGYDGRTPFPLMFWFHGIGQDEKNFLFVVPHFDRAIRCGQMPPCVIVCPDGSIKGKPTLLQSGSFYINSNAGRFEDYVMQDVWDFATRCCAVHPHRGAHVLAGGSMGGFAAYNLGIKYRDRVATVVGLLPPLNIRYTDSQNHRFPAYDPATVAMREELRPCRPIARFFGVIVVREKRLTRALVGARNPEGIAIASRENPIEMLAAHDVRPGELAMFVGYAGRDEFNIHNQCKHFFDVARGRELEVTAVEVPDGRHRTESGVRMLPELSAFLWRELAAFVPPGYRPCGPAGGVIEPGPTLEELAGVQTPPPAPRK